MDEFNLTIRFLDGEVRKCRCSPAPSGCREPNQMAIRILALEAEYPAKSPIYSAGPVDASVTDNSVTESTGESA